MWRCYLIWWWFAMVGRWRKCSSSATLKLLLWLTDRSAHFPKWKCSQNQNSFSLPQASSMVVRKLGLHINNRILFMPRLLHFLYEWLSSQNVIASWPKLHSYHSIVHWVDESFLFYRTHTHKNSHTELTWTAHTKLSDGRLCKNVKFRRTIEHVLHVGQLN